MRFIVPLLTILAFVVPAMGGSDIVYEVDGKKYEGYFASARPGAPLVLIIHDWDGLTEYEMKRADMLAEMGYGAFAADLFGQGVRPTETQEKRQLTADLYADRERMRALMRGALDEARSRGAEVGNAVAIGYCFGGTAVLELARSGAALKGFVSFHGGLATPEGQNYSAVKGSVLVFHGSADQVIGLEQFADLASRLEQHGVAHEMITYSGAPHAFSVFGSDRYHQDADKKSWRRFRALLAEMLE